MSVEVILDHLKCDIQLITNEWGVSNAETRRRSVLVPNNVGKVESVAYI